MKALSFHQPWAELILQGRKTIEVRTWFTRYRGPLAMHVAQALNEQACAAYALEPESLVRGALVGIVEVVDVVPIDEANWQAWQGEHLAIKPYPGPVFGWRLANPRRLAVPVPMAGRQGLYSVPDQLLAAATAGPCTREQMAFAWDAPAASHDPQRPFELRVVRYDGNGYGLALYQWPLRADGAQQRGRGAQPERLAELSGDRLDAVVDHILEALRGAGYRASELGPARRAPFRLSEEAGLRLALLFLSVRPLSRLDRVEAISSGLRAMPSEEAYYWFSKCTAGDGAANAQRALRTLLAGE